MNFTPAQDSDEIEFNLVPLIDVILTLLIFFMISTTFEQRSLLRVDLPEASAEPTPAANQGLVIVIDAEGRYFVDGREVLGGDGAALRAALESHAGDDRGQSVVVRADAASSHQSVVTALDVLGQLGFVRIALATVQAGEDG
ncbi:MAG: biopolymer transporter ExbD [Pseudoxanthomonas sp.]|nr:biopolymer transporter ExbD [Pseudoxanthomonas sp.]